MRECVCVLDATPEQCRMHVVTHKLAVITRAAPPLRRRRAPVARERNSHVSYVHACMAQIIEHLYTEMTHARKQFHTRTRTCDGYLRRIWTDAPAPPVRRLSRRQEISVEAVWPRRSIECNFLVCAPLTRLE